MISLHTSPLDQPGTGDAGGMNVYVLELARRLAARDVEVDVFTRATGSTLPPTVDVGDGIHRPCIATAALFAPLGDGTPGEPAGQSPGSHVWIVSGFRRQA